MHESSFGYRRVKPGEKTSLVGEVFSSVASNYDLMNNVMSLGVHHLWKDRFVSEIERPGAAILDMAGGTGDITDRCYNRAMRAGKTPNITLCDINEAMLEQARDRFIDAGKIEGISIHTVNAETLPFDDNQFDYYTIAFGLRNVTHIDKALKEACRVLKPGGKFLCLEFSKVTMPLLSRFYDIYSEAIPTLGRVIAKDEGSYRYLVDSIRQFPDQRTLEGMMEEAGFGRVRHRNLSAGIVAIHTGWSVS